MDVVAVETLIADLHPGAKRAHCGEVFDRESNRFGGGFKAAITKRLSRPTLAFCHEQLSRNVVVEFGRVAFHYCSYPQSTDSIELAFLDDPLVRLVRALDAILPVITFGRQQVRDLVDAACATATAERPGREVDA